jgi:hypothetical protein
MEPFNSLCVYYRQNQKSVNALLARLSEQKVPGAAVCYARLLAAQTYGDFERYVSAASLCELPGKLTEDAFSLLYELHSIDAAQDTRAPVLDMQGMPLFSAHEDHIAFIRYFFERKLKEWESLTGTTLTGEALVQDKGNHVQVVVSLAFGAKQKQLYRKQREFSGYQTLPGLFRTFEPFAAEIEDWVKRKATAAEKAAAREARERHASGLGLLGFLSALFFIFG